MNTTVTSFDLYQSYIKKIELNCEINYVSCCPQLTEISQAPQKARYIRLSNLPNLATLATLVSEVVSLDNLHILKEIPLFKAEHLSMEHLPQITKLDIDESLKTLSIFNLQKLNKIQAFHEGLETITIDKTSLTALPPLPKGLKELSIRRSKITQIDSFPVGLESLIIQNTPVECIPPIPEGVQRLIIENTSADLTNLVLPNTLKFLYLGLSKEQYLQMNIPEGCRVAVGKGKYQKKHTYTCGELIY